MIRRIATGALAALIAYAVPAPPADAARVGVLSNKYAAETAAMFAANVSGHTFTGVDVSTGPPPLAALTAKYDVLLLFEDGLFADSTAVGNVVAQFANSGRAVVLGTFYDQDRSDQANVPALVSTGHGWGALETIDPNTTDGIGTPTDASGVPNAPRTLDAASIVAHPLTVGVKSLTSSAYAGGNEAKPGTIVVAKWTQPNARGKADPAIAYRTSGVACVVHVGIAPDYPVIPNLPAGSFGGDFYQVWKNAFDFGAAGCPLPPATDAPTVPAGPDGAASIPTLSPVGIALTALLVAAGALASRRLSRAPRR
jgi:hypothetical protein